MQRLEARRVDESLLVKAAYTQEVYRGMQQTEAVRYTIGAMQPIDPDYTKNTYAQGDKVKNQLKERLSVKCQFEYQGSVTTDTHIRARSDIDLLVIHDMWFYLEPPQVPANPYRGDPCADMRALREGITSGVNSAFPAVKVDDSGSTAVSLSGGSLSREVDVVPACWYDTNAYSRTRDPVYRGVEVFDKKTGAFTPNLPFLHKREIELRDQKTQGGLRRAARLMKSLMYDSEGRVTMTSYNIVGIAFNMPEADLIMPRPRELSILEACCAFCERLATDGLLRASIRVPDGHRAVFGDKPGASVQELEALTKELHDLRRDVLNENARSFKRLAEARVDYPFLDPGIKFPRPTVPTW